MTVYVPQFNEDRNKIDISDLHRYGAVRVLTSRHVYPDDDEPGAYVLKVVTRALQGFDPNTDYLALVGSYVHMAACLYALGALGKTPVALLCYDRVFNQYYPVDVDMEDINAFRQEANASG